MCFHLYPEAICCQSAPDCFAVMGDHVCAARPCIISHFPTSSRRLGSFLLRPSADLNPWVGGWGVDGGGRGGGARLLTNGLQEKSKERPVRALLRCFGDGVGVGGAENSRNIQNSSRCRTLRESRPV